VLTADLELIAPPTAISAADLSPSAIPNAWTDSQATVEQITEALRSKFGYPPPQTLIADAIREGIQGKRYEVASGVWPPSPGSDGQVVLRVAQVDSTRDDDLIITPPLLKPPGMLSAEAILTGFQLQKLGELVEQLSGAAPELKLSCHELITAEGNGADPSAIASLNELLQEASEKLKLQ